MRKTAYINATLLTGKMDMVPQPSMTVLVENQKIIAIEPTEGNYENCNVVDLRGYYLMPGLINLHLHLAGSGANYGGGKKNPEKVQRLLNIYPVRMILQNMCANYAKTQLYSGVTTIRTVGGLRTIDSTIRNQINAGKRLGPRMLVADMAISVPGGHMAGLLAYSAKSAEECVTLVQKIALTNPDLIKIMITGGVLDATEKGEPGVVRMPLEMVKACCDEAHKLGLMVAAHVESTKGIEIALEGGVDTIEHGAELNANLIKLFLQKKASNICTISPAIPLTKFDSAITKSDDLIKYNGNIVLNGIISAAKTALTNGIPVGLGTDSACPFVTHYDMWRELQYFHKYVGVSRTFALHTATLKNAEIVGIHTVTGSIEVGKSADMLIVRDNPVENLTVLRKPYMVVIKGKIIKKPRIKKYHFVENLLDNLKL